MAFPRIARAICIVTFPLGESAYMPLLDLVEILRPRTKRLYILSGGVATKILEARSMSNVISVRHGSHQSPLNRTLSYVLTNFKFLAKIITLRKHVRLFVFYIGAESLLIPMLGARLLGGKTVLIPAADPGKIAKSRGDPLTKALSVLTACNFYLADILVLYSERMFEEFSLRKYRHKVTIAHHHFMDFDEFGPRTDIKSRALIVGFVGRLDREKGILNLVQAIPMVLERVAAEFVICGDGSLRKEVLDFLGSRGLLSNVRMEGWVNHQILPGYFNEFRLLVLPSYTEALPNVALEAMACGTPVLMTRVGTLPEMVSDGKEIFFLHSNDSKDIADAVASLLTESSRLQQVSAAALDFVRTNFNYHVTSQTWDTLLSDLGS